MKTVSLENFSNNEPFIISSTQFHSHLLGKSYLDDNTTATRIHNNIIFFLSNGLVKAFVSTIYDHTGGCAKRYHCISYPYIFSCLDS